MMLNETRNSIGLDNTKTSINIVDQVGRSNSKKKFDEKQETWGANDGQMSTKKSPLVNIQTKADLKLLSGQSSFKASALKKSNQIAKKAVHIKPQFLPKKDEEWLLRQDRLFEMTQQVLPDGLKKLFDKKAH